MNLEELIKSKTSYNKYPTLRRIKIGRILSFIAALPLCTSWLFAISIPMMIPISPNLWFKDKVRYFKEWRMLK